MSKGTNTLHRGNGLRNERKERLATIAPRTALLSATALASWAALVPQTHAGCAPDGNQQGRYTCSGSNNQIIQYSFGSDPIELVTEPGFAVDTTGQFANTAIAVQGSDTVTYSDTHATPSDRSRIKANNDGAAFEGVGEVRVETNGRISAGAGQSPVAVARGVRAAAGPNDSGNALTSITIGSGADVSASGTSEGIGVLSEPNPFVARNGVDGRIDILIESGASVAGRGLGSGTGIGIKATAPDDGDLSIHVERGARIEGVGSNAQNGYGIVAKDRTVTLRTAGRIEGRVVLDAFDSSTLELRPGFDGIGGVTEALGASDAFVLGGLSSGGGIDHTFDASSIDFSGDNILAGGGAVMFEGFETFAKKGSSLFALTGASGETGQFGVEGGVLLVNGDYGSLAMDVTGGLLGGTGTVGDITLHDDAVLSPGMIDGNGTSRIGTLTANDVVLLSGSSLAIDLAENSASDQLLARSVVLDDARLAITTGGTAGALASDDRFAIIQTGANGVAGQFASIEDDVPDIEFVATYGTDEVVLGIGLDAEQSEKSIAPATTVAPIGVGRAFVSSMIGNGLGGASFMTLRPLELWDEERTDGSVEESRDGGDVTGQAIAEEPSTAFAFASNTALGAALDRTDRDIYRADTVTLDGVQVGDSPVLSFFAGGLLSSIEIDAQEDLSGYDVDSYGGLGGVRAVQRLLNGHLVYGASLGYARARVDTAGGIANGRGEADIDIYQGGVFAGLITDRLIVSGAATYGYLDYETRRDLETGDGMILATGDTRGDLVAGSLEVSYDLASLLSTSLGFRSVDHTSVAPFAGMEGVYVGRDGYTENNTTLSIGGSEATVGFARAGVRLAHRMSAGEWVVRPSVMIGYERAFGDLGSDDAIDLGFGLDAPTAAIAELDENRLLVGAGLDFGTGSFHATVNYEGSIASHSQMHAGTLGFSYRF